MTCSYCGWPPGAGHFHACPRYTESRHTATYSYTGPDGPVCTICGKGIESGIRRGTWRHR
jgi:hypothetical protein